MDRFYSNITGCIRCADYLDAAKWLDKAKVQLDDESYLILLWKVFDKYPLMANSEHFAYYKISELDGLDALTSHRLNSDELVKSNKNDIGSCSGVQEAKMEIEEDELDREFIKKRENSHEITIDIKDL